LSRKRFLGIDPGNAKCGYAVVYEDGERAALEVVPTPAMPARIQADVAEGDVAGICIGDATTSKAMFQLCARRWPSIPVALVDERNTSLQARGRYYADHPPRGLLRLVPRGLLVPNEPLDGYAALLIVERFLKTR
jgi:RNase H-fold protein (predicted Holliday junction resolvase)